MTKKPIKNQKNPRSAAQKIALLALFDIGLLVILLIGMGYVQNKKQAQSTPQAQESTTLPQAQQEPSQQERLAYYIAQATRLKDQLQPTFANTISSNKAHFAALAGNQRALINLLGDANTSIQYITKKNSKGDTPLAILQLLPNKTPYAIELLKPFTHGFRSNNASSVAHLLSHLELFPTNSQKANYLKKLTEVDTAPKPYNLLDYAVRTADFDLLVYIQQNKPLLGSLASPSEQKKLLAQIKTLNEHIDKQEWQPDTKKDLKAVLRVIPYAIRVDWAEYKKIQKDILEGTFLNDSQIRIQPPQNDDANLNQDHYDASPYLLAYFVIHGATEKLEKLLQTRPYLYQQTIEKTNNLDYFPQCYTLCWAHQPTIKNKLDKTLQKVWKNSKHTFMYDKNSTQKVFNDIFSDKEQIRKENSHDKTPLHYLLALKDPQQKLIILDLLYRSRIIYPHWQDHQGRNLMHYAMQERQQKDDPFLFQWLLQKNLFDSGLLYLKDNKGKLPREYYAKFDQHIAPPLAQQGILIFHREHTWYKQVPRLGTALIARARRVWQTRKNIYNYITTKHWKPDPNHHHQ